MKKSYRSFLVLIATVTAVSLYAYLGPDPTQKNTEKRLAAVVATATLNKKDATAIDQTTGLPVLRHSANELVFTSDINEAVASKLVEQLIAAGFFRSTTSHKMILGREPNSYVIFYTRNKLGNGNEDQAILKKSLPQLSSAVFNHQPVVIKVINEEKEVQQVIM